MDSKQQKNPFLKQLASSDRQLRDKALESLQTYLSVHRKFDELELLKLWKGLFYCMWMCDKPIPQQRLARSLASLLFILPKDTVIPFLSAFWKTIGREWLGIDVLRMNKFLYLTRQYVNATFQYLEHLKWKQDAVDSHMEVLVATPLSLNDQKISNGLRYHVLDVFMDELEKVAEGQEKKVPIENILRPVIALGEKSLTKQVRERVKEFMEDERLNNFGPKR